MKKITVFTVVFAVLFSMSVGPVAQVQAAPGLFVRSLVRGMSGEDVLNLQTLLAADTSVYPEGLLTGYFGARTEAAVKRFQKKHGIEQVGVFGPKSQARMEWLFSSSSASTSLSFLPPGLAKKLGGEATGTGNTSTTSAEGKVTLCHMPPGNANAKQTIVVGAPAIPAHLAHGDTVGACGGSTLPPDTTAPTLSNISATSVASTTATIIWNTNEVSDSTVWFGTTTPVVLGSPTLSLSNAALVTSHSIGLSGLASSTTYYYAVQSKDAANNIATSTTLSFITLP